MPASKKKAVRADVTLEEANAIVLAARDAELREKAAQARRDYVGKFFKYKNSYGTGKTWWMYMAATGVDGVGCCTGWSFEQSSRRHIQIDGAARHYLWGGGWIEITPSEFWVNAARVTFAVQTQLAKPAKRASGAAR